MPKFNLNPIPNGRFFAPWFKAARLPVFTEMQIDAARLRRDKVKLPLSATTKQVHQAEEQALMQSQGNPTHGTEPPSP